MQGRVANIATGIALLNLFRQRLQKRQQKLKQAIKSWDGVEA
jgi:exonuclease VII small subunit